MSNVPTIRVFYNVTEPPQNGSLYWVAGETTAAVFTQKNVDDGDILYAQLNMNAYQDEFEFVLSNEEMELMPRRARILVRPAVWAHTLQAEPMSIIQIGDVHLNTSSLRGGAPRFLVASVPKYGRFFLYPRTNDTVTYFTQSNINEGRLFFQTYHVQGPLQEDVLLELRADNVQPARFNWTVQIVDTDGGTNLTKDGKRIVAVNPNKAAGDGGRGSAAELNYGFPVGILIAIVLGVIGFLMCRKGEPEQKRPSTQSGDAIPGIGTRELPDPDAEPAGKPRKSATVLQPGPARAGNDLLEQTVYADPARSPQAALVREGTPTLHQHAPMAGPSTGRQLSTFGGEAPPAGRRLPPGPAYKSTPLSMLVNTNSGEGPPPPKRSDSQAPRLSENQYWV